MRCQGDHDGSDFLHLCRVAVDEDKSDLEDFQQEVVRWNAVNFSEFKGKTFFEDLISRIKNVCLLKYWAHQFS